MDDILVQVQCEKEQEQSEEMLLSCKVNAFNGLGVSVGAE